MQSTLIKIATIGDSLTEGNGRGLILREIPSIPGIYQSYTYAILKQRGFPIEITNFGIGGQIVNEICFRFKQIVPTNIIVSMAGTNDCWRFSNAAVGVEEDMAIEIIENYQSAIKTAREIQAKNKMPPLFFIIAAIPPVGNVSTLPKNMKNAIQIINDRLKNFVKTQNDPNISFCDVFKAMSNSKGDMQAEFHIPDGVHFTPEGNEACGKTIAECLTVLLKKNFTR